MFVLDQQTGIAIHRACVVMVKLALKQWGNSDCLPPFGPLV